MSMEIIYRLANYMNSEKFKLLNDAFNGPDENSIENIKRYLGNIDTERVFVAEYTHNMWNDSDVNALQFDLQESIMSNEAEVFIAYMDDTPVGVAQCGLRKDYVEGTDSNPVGYLEGIYVREGFRKKSIAIMLSENCEKWAIGMGCKEFASDCELDNKESLEFHLAIGFTEANRIICFTKQLTI